MNNRKSIGLIMLLVIMTIIGCKNYEWIRIRHIGENNKPIAAMCIMKGKNKDMNSRHVYIVDDKDRHDLFEYHFYVTNTTFQHIMDYIKHYQTPIKSNINYMEYGSHVVLLCKGKDIIKSTWNNNGIEEEWNENSVIRINSKEQVLLRMDNSQSSSFFSGLLPLVKKEDELSQFIKGRILQISAIDSFYPPNYNKK